MSKRGQEYLDSPEKRSLDVVSGIALAGALALPSTLITGLAAVNARTLEPILRQERVGRGGQVFKVFKIKTIRDALVDAEVATYGTFDPRATKVGLALRQYGLDEVPQILNVLIGNMSMVGTRPLLSVDIEKRAELDPMLFEEWLEVYLGAKPGLTGHGQLLRHRYREVPPEIQLQSMVMDIDYAENASLAGDLRILGRTPLELLSLNAELAKQV